jgi:hypothetical protein
MIRKINPSLKATNKNAAIVIQNSGSYRLFDEKSRRFDNA